MGFSVSKWVRHATKIPKSIKKIQLKPVVIGAAKGLVSGGVGGAVLGAGAAAKAEHDRVKDEQASERAAKLEAEAYAASEAQANQSLKGASITGFSQLGTQGQQSNLILPIAISGVILIIIILIARR